MAEIAKNITVKRAVATINQSGGNTVVTYIKTGRYPIFLAIRTKTCTAGILCDEIIHDHNQDTLKITNARTYSSKDLDDQTFKGITIISLKQEIIMFPQQPIFNEAGKHEKPISVPSNFEYNLSCIQDECPESVSFPGKDVTVSKKDPAILSHYGNAKVRAVGIEKGAIVKGEIKGVNVKAFSITIG